MKFIEFIGFIVFVLGGLLGYYIGMALIMKITGRDSKDNGDYFDFFVD